MISDLSIRFFENIPSHIFAVILINVIHVNNSSRLLRVNAYTVCILYDDFGMLCFTFKI